MTTYRVYLAARNPDVKAVDADPALQDLVAFLRTHIDLVEPVFFALTQMPNASEFSARWNELQKFRQISGSDRGHISRLQELVRTFYKAPTHQSSLPEDEYLDYLRGRTAELIVLHLVERKFQQLSNSHTVDNPAVYINGRILNHLGKETIDVGAVSPEPELGVFLEVKVSPGTFQDKDIGYLESLVVECQTLGYPGTVAGACMHSRNQFDGGSYSHLPTDHPAVTWWGIEDVLGLRWAS